MSPKDVSTIIKALEKTYKGTLLASASSASPFRILISTVLSQRTQDASTARASKALFSKYGTPKKLASAPIREIERLVKPSGFYKTKARRIRDIARIITDKYKGVVPKDINELLSLPGVGRKTACCVLVYAFDESAIPVDTHVHRISNRLGWVRTRTPEETERELMRIVDRRHWIQINDLLVSHGQNICKPITPLCSKCPITRLCARVDVTKSR